MRILAALSGGVDSAVAAARLVREGAEVVGVHLRTGVESDGAGAGGGRSCCGADDARDARRVASRLGIPFYVVDVAQAFAGVLAAFVGGYARGETPNPCVTCNQRVKFGRLVELATGLGCEAVATGHYARVGRGANGRYRLLASRDSRKDQTYVLHALDQAQLARARFPVGSLQKDEVRAMARALGLEVADKPDSQELCFVGAGDYRAYLQSHAPDALVSGEVVDEDGRVLGRHDGAAGYTVGQRKGLPALGARRYVVEVDAQAGRVVVGPRARAFASALGVRDVNWIDTEGPAPGTVLEARARVRHGAPATRASLEVRGPTALHVRFDEPVFAPAPGQALVAYVGEAVLCGGTIERGLGPAARPQEAVTG